MNSTPRSLVTLALATVSCACSHSPSVRTYADVEVAVTRMQAEWQRSQLTEQPQQVLITQDRRYELFFKLPLIERAIVVMDQFANIEFDGEVAFTMALMLRYRTQPASGDAELTRRIRPRSFGSSTAIRRSRCAASASTMRHDTLVSDATCNVGKSIANSRPSAPRATLRLKLFTAESLRWKRTLLPSDESLRITYSELVRPHAHNSHRPICCQLLIGLGGAASVT
jgi:hypothetical protein